VWLVERGGSPTEPLFPTSTGKPLTRKALARRIAKHATHAAERCPSLTAKTITPHVLRHTAAMRLLHAGVDTTVIALWLGHEQVETTQMYLHADLALEVFLSQSHRSGSELRLIGGAPAVGFGLLDSMVGDPGPAGVS
jgi:site-specific recombinase XerD